MMMISSTIPRYQLDERGTTFSQYILFLQVNFESRRLMEVHA